MLALCPSRGMLCNIKGIFEQFELELPHNPLFATLRRKMFFGIILGGGLSHWKTNIELNQCPHVQAGFLQETSSGTCPPVSNELGLF